MLYAGPQPDVILITLALAFVPSIILVIILRYTEKYEREPWGAVWTAFLWGATASVVLVIFAIGYFKSYMMENYAEIASDRHTMKLYISCLIIPIVAELVKLMSLFFVREELNEAEDGLIYGGVAGLGFAATEMLLYGLSIHSAYGIKVFIQFILLSTVTVVILQASVGAIAGYGISRAVAKHHKKGSLWLSPVFLIGAIACHSLFSYIANSTASQGGFDVLSYKYALIFAIGISAITWVWIWIKIIRLDRMDDPKKKKENKPGKFSFGERAGFDSPLGPDARATSIGSSGPGSGGQRGEGYDDYYDEGYDDEYDDYYDEGYDDGYDGYDDYDDEGYDDEYDDYDDEGYEDEYY